MWAVKNYSHVAFAFSKYISEFCLTYFSAKNCFDVFMIVDIVLDVHRKISLADEGLWLYTRVFAQYTKLTMLAFVYNF